MVRCLVLVLFPLVPMKTEIFVARTVFKCRVLPALRDGNLSIVMNSLLRILFCRLGIIWLSMREVVRRLAYGKKLLQVDHRDNAVDPPDSSDCCRRLCLERGLEVA